MRTFIFKPGIPNKELNDYIRSLPIDGKEYNITIKKNNPIRSLTANAYYHVILNLIAIHTGQGTGDQHFDHTELHEIFKKKFNGKMKIFPKGGSEVIGQSTKSLDSKQFAEFINKVKNFAREEWGTIIPEPQDVTVLREMEIQNNYERTFSGW